MRTAKEWRIPIDEWDRLPMDAKMEMMAHIDVEDKIDAFIRYQRDSYRKSKGPKLNLKKGRSG